MICLENKTDVFLVQLAALFSFQLVYGFMKKIVLAFIKTIQHTNYIQQRRFS